MKKFTILLASLILCCSLGVQASNQSIHDLNEETQGVDVLVPDIQQSQQEQSQQQEQQPSSGFQEGTGTIIPGSSSTPEPEQKHEIPTVPTTEEIEIDIPQDVLEQLKSAGYTNSTRLLVKTATDMSFTMAKSVIHFEDVYAVTYPNIFVANVMKLILQAKPSVESVEFDNMIEISSVVEQQPQEESRDSIDDLDNPLSLSQKFEEHEVQKSIKVAILDTGCDSSVLTNPELVLDTNINVATTGELNSTADDNGHGTILAKIVQANANSGVFIVPIKIADKDGSASIFNTYAGIRMAMDLGVDIINLSLNTAVSEESEILTSVVKEATAAGIKVVVSAGNNGTDTKEVAPSNVGEAIVVGAVHNFELAQYSNYGETIDYVSYGDWDGEVGTSFAAARVTGILANAFTRGLTEEDLLTVDLGDPGVDSKFGKGLLVNGAEDTSYRDAVLERAGYSDKLPEGAKNLLIQARYDGKTHYERKEGLLYVVIKKDSKQCTYAVKISIPQNPYAGPQTITYTPTLQAGATLTGCNITIDSHVTSQDGWTGIDGWVANERQYLFRIPINLPVYEGYTPYHSSITGNIDPFAMEAGTRTQLRYCTNTNNLNITNYSTDGKFHISTITIEYKPHVATVRYHANGGTANSSYKLKNKLAANKTTGKLITTSVKYTDSVVDLYNTTTLFSKEGYHIPANTGWRINSNSGTLISGAADTSATNITKLLKNGNATVTLYPNWEANTYKIAFRKNNNDATGSTASVSATYDTPVRLTANGFSLAGETFSGWNTAANGSGEDFENRELVENLTSENDETVLLYAQWGGTKYQLRFRANGGTAKSGYSLNSSGTVFTGDTAEDGKQVKQYIRSTATTMDLRNPGTFFQRTGYHIKSGKGWRFGSDTGTEVSQVKGTSATTITSAFATNPATYKFLYANWEVNSGNVYYDANGGVINTAQGYFVSGQNLYSIASDGTVQIANPPTAAPKDLTTTIAYTSGTFKPWAPTNIQLYKKGYHTDATYTWNTEADMTGSWLTQNADYYSWAQTQLGVTSKHGEDLTLYVNWVPNTYNIVYNANDGSGSMGTTVATYDKAINLAVNGFTRPGYRFAGWATTSTGPKAYDDYQSVLNLTDVHGGTVTLYALWEENYGKVFYHANGGTAINSYSVNSDGLIHYTNGALASQTFKSSYTAMDLLDAAYMVKKTGYYVADPTKAWRVGSANAETYASQAANSDATIIKNAMSLNTVSGASLYLYANWTPKFVNVTFHRNDGSTTSTNATYTYDVTNQAFPDTDWTKTGYHIAGWSTNPNATTAEYEAQYAVTNAWIESNFGTDIELYAVWKVNSGNIKFTDVYGTPISPFSLDANSILLENGTVLAIPFNYKTTGVTIPSVEEALSRTGYYIDSEKAWKINGSSPVKYVPNGGGDSSTLIAFADLKNKHDVTVLLSPNWQPKKLSVTFRKNDGSTTYTSRSYVYDRTNQVFPNVSWTRYGYEFLGWSSDPNATTPEYSYDYAVTNEWIDANSPSLELYAVWKRLSFTVLYDYRTNGGDSATTVAKTVLVFDPVDLTPTATKTGDTGQYSSSNPDGWQFVGWHTDPSAKEALASLEMPANDVTLYAIYKKNVTATFIDYQGTQRVVRQTSGAAFNTETSVYLYVTQNDMKDAEAIGWCTSTSPEASTVPSFFVSKDTQYYGKYRRTIKQVYHNFKSAKTFSNWQYLNSYDIRNITAISSTAPAIQTKANWDAIGWTDESDRILSAEFNPYETITTKESKHYYAIYQRDYTVKYDTKGKGKPVEPKTIRGYYNTYGAVQPAVVTMPKCTPYYETKFYGWNTTYDLKGTVYRMGQKVTLNADTTLYAQFEKIQATAIKTDSSIMLLVGEQKRIQATVTPADVYDNSLSWVSADKTIATVDGSGQIVGKNAGTTTITVSSVSNPAISSTIYVQVLGGSVSLPTSVVLGQKATVSLQANSGAKANLTLTSISQLRNLQTGTSYPLKLLDVSGQTMETLKLEVRGEERETTFSVVTEVPTSALEMGQYQAEMLFKLQLSR